MRLYNISVHKTSSLAFVGSCFHTYAGLDRFAIIIFLHVSDLLIWSLSVQSICGHDYFILVTHISYLPRCLMCVNTVSIFCVNQLWSWQCHLSFFSPSKLAYWRTDIQGWSWWDVWCLRWLLIISNSLLLSYEAADIARQTPEFFPPYVQRGEINKIVCFD